MSPDHTPFKTTRRRDRLMATVAALTTSVAINSAVLLCFDSTSPAQWLVATPELQQRLARCEARPTR